MSTYFQVCLANLAKVINCDSNNVLWNRYYKSNRKYRSIAIDRIRPQTLRGGILGTWQYCSHNCSSCCRAGLLTQFLWPATACHWSGFRRLQKIGRNIITSECNRTENVHGCINEAVIEVLKRYILYFITWIIENINSKIDCDFCFNFNWLGLWFTRYHSFIFLSFFFYFIIHFFIRFDFSLVSDDGTTETYALLSYDIYLFISTTHYTNFVTQEV